MVSNEEQAKQRAREQWERAAQDLRPRLEDYLISKGLPIKKAFLCLNPEHGDRSPSMSYDSRRHRVHCFSCGCSYDIFDLVGMEYGLTESKAILEKVASMYNYQLQGGGQVYQNQSKTEQCTHSSIHTSAYTQPQPKDYSRMYEEAHKRLSETQYLQERGISSEVAERFNLGYMPEYMTRDHEGQLVKWPVVIIPTSKNTYVVRNTTPQAHHKDRYRKKGEAHLFNAVALKEALAPIFVVEGELDAMSIIEAGGSAVGLGSYDNVPLFLKAVEAYKPTQPIVLAFDKEAEPDKAKRVEEATAKAEEGLDKLGVKHYRRSPQGEYKDANEALQKDREALVEAVGAVAHIEDEAEEEAKEAYFQQNQVSLHLQSFIGGIAESVNTPCTPTGFTKLDSALDGGLYEGLITIGAISSLGKTTLIMQIADQIAASGTDVIIFSLEMARAELMAKSISRHTLLLAQERKLDIKNAKTARGIMDGKRYANYNSTEAQLIKDAITVYSEYAPHLFIKEGVGEVGVAQIRETVEAHIRYTGRRPIVVVDYLQILSPYSERLSDKQNTDKNVMELKRISRDYKLPVLAISSFNRMSYNESVTMEAFKESGAIEYSSDILFGLQLKGAGGKDFDPTAEKKKDPRQIELVVLKNRSGRVGDKIGFSYYPLFNYYKEA